MKNLILIISSLFFFHSFTFAQPSNRKVQLAILFDTSNSMDGLIDQAKTRIWSIINEVSTLRYQGETPIIEIAIYQYGNDGLEASQGYIQQVTPLTSDLDLISKRLFALTTNGGSEHCGQVIGQSLSGLNWSEDERDLKLIYIAGNESFTQGPVDYKKQCSKAKEKGIVISTIFCGNYKEGVYLEWEKGATCSGGDYFNIDSDASISHIKTPYDEEIIRYNDSLNKTYHGYGSYGRIRKTEQVMEDENANVQSYSVAVERSVTKSKKNIYNNSSWDLIDAIENDKVKLEDVKEEDLPDFMKGKTLEEKKALLAIEIKKREYYQKKIAELAIKRDQYISEERKKQSNEQVDDFGSSLNESIKRNANKIGYER